MASATGSSSPPPPPGGGPGKGFGPSHNISKVNIPPNGDGSSTEKVKYSYDLERDPNKQPQYVIRPISRLDPWVCTTESDARYYAQGGQQVFHSHNGQPVTNWNLRPLAGVQPNTAFYVQDERRVKLSRVKVEQGFAVHGNFLGEENVMGADNAGVEEPDFSGSVVSSGTTEGASSYGKPPPTSSIGGGSIGMGRSGNIGSPVRSPPRSQPISPRSPPPGPAFGSHPRHASGASGHARQASGTVSTPHRRGISSDLSSPLRPGSRGSGSARSPKDFQSFEDVMKSPSSGRGKGRDFGSGNRSSGGGGGSTA
ncbi:hypothetical protein EK21DRAFT_108821 [Setomelanomma holmii]|uniref:Uncharacterized protein n=1 Tax=Setomelanomma holmii TaxID=210430 RepID=A0A9P4LND7_9PLEO|nr:hypothetical protein EK21DRAFT_108821 [Setomelanomma holmii]